MTLIKQMNIWNLWCCSFTFNSCFAHKAYMYEIRRLMKSTFGVYVSLTRSFNWIAVFTGLWYKIILPKVHLHWNTKLSDVNEWNRLVCNLKSTTTQLHLDSNQSMTLYLSSSYADILGAYSWALSWMVNRKRCQFCVLLAKLICKIFLCSTKCAIEEDNIS